MAAGKLYNASKRPRVPRSYKKYVNKQISKRTETKRITPASALRADVQPTAGLVISKEFTAISQGNAANNRIGDRISVMNVQAHLTFEKRNATDTSNICRVIIYSPKDPSAEISTVQVQGNPDLSQFVILYDKTFSLFYEDTKSFDVKLRFPKGRHVEYDGSGAASGMKGRLWMYVVSDSSTTSAPKLTYRMRTFYKDA